MLWRSALPALFQRLSLDLDLAVSQARKAEARRRLDFYHDEQANHLFARLQEIFSEPEKLSLCYAINLLRKVINAKAAVYVSDAHREIEGGTEQDREILAQIAETAGLSVKMKTASRYTKLLKTVLLRPAWRRGRMDLDILTGDVLDVLTGDTPEDLRRVLITHNPETGRSDEVEYSLWTPETVSRLDYNGSVIAQDANPYRLLPFVPLWDGCPTESFWLRGGADLVNAQEALNEKLTDLLYVIRQQGFGVGWIRKGKQSGGQITVDPGTLVELPENGALGFESQKAPIREIVSAIQFLIEQVGISHGLSGTSLSTKVHRESGSAKVAGTRELEEQRRDDITLFRRYELNLFEVFRTVWNAHNPARRLSPSARLRVDFYDPKPVISAKDQAETWQILTGLGVISSVDVAMERYPDLKTRAEAEAFLLKVREENLKFGRNKNAAAAANGGGIINGTQSNS
jgi:hypothetical protein